MQVDSVKFSTPYYLHYPLLPTISLLDHVKGLIEAYNTKFTTEENIIISAKLVIEKISQLEDISVQRECLCRLLNLEIEEIQNLIVEEVKALFDFTTLVYDIQHDQAQQLIDLEEIVSEIIEVKLTSNELNLIIPICSIYQSILEHLWLLSYLEYGNHCSHLLIQNKDAILSHMERWKDSLDQLTSKEKISHLIPKNLEKAVLRLFKPLPEAVAKEIEEQKSVIHKSWEMSLRILEIIADFYGSQGDFHRAIFHEEVFLNFLRKRLSEISQKEEILVKIMQIHEKISNWYEKLRMYQGTILHLEKALKIARELNDPSIIIYLKKIGYLYSAQGQHDLALPFYQEALTIAQILKDPKIERLFLGVLAEIYIHIGSNEEAIRCYQATLELAEEKTEQALLYSEIGGAHARAKQYKEAEEAYEKALEILPQGNNPFMAITVHENLTTFFRNFGQYEKAIYHAKKIEVLIQDPSVQTDELQAQVSKFSALVNLGNIYDTLGDHARRIDYYTQAVKFAEKANVHLNHLRIAYANLGSAYCDEGNYFEGIKYYKKVSKISKGDFNQAKLLKNIGKILFSFGKFTEAIEYYEEANKVGDQDTKKDNLLSLGLCYDALGNKEQAIQNIEKFICLSQASEDRHSEAQGYHNLGEVYRKFNHSLAEENYRKSIAVYSTLHQKLKNHSQWQITFFEKQALPSFRLESLLLEQAKNEEALQITDFRRSRALVSALTEKFQFQKDDFLISSELTAQEMQALAHKLNTCFILYSFTSKSTDSITAWIIPSDGEIICQPLPLGILTEGVEEATYVFQTFPFAVEERVIEESVDSFLEGLTRGESNDSLNAKNLKSFKKHLSLWYEALVAPIEAYLPKDPQQVVTIIPDGYFAQIPFAAFLDQEGIYLIEKHPLSIAPSIGILSLLDQLPKDFSRNSLVIGNPTTSGSQLKFAEKEAQTIVAPLLETAPKKILLQDKATVHAVVGGMADARWIHLACHGSTGKKPDEKIDPHSVFEGLFKLASDESHSQGYLHAQEIAKFTLRAELVFMSACFSGRGKLHGEGSVGPVWSFLAAGALSTVATYWQLPDTELTLQMVETFYRQFLGIGVEKLNKAQALQKAMLVGIEQARERPDRWGAFFLSGLYE